MACCRRSSTATFARSPPRSAGCRRAGRGAWHLRPLVFVLSRLRGSVLSPFGKRAVQLLASREWNLVHHRIRVTATNLASLPTASERSRRGPNAENCSMVRIALLLAALTLPGLSMAQAAQCTLRLKVELTADVEHRKDPAFLSALVGDPRYSLVLVSASNDSEVLQLTGPPNTCRNEVKIMRMSSYVIDIQVIDDSNQD
jgi:hypothetical protein